MPLIQNFPVPRGNDAMIMVVVTSNVVGETLVGATIFWNVYAQAHGVVATDSSGNLLAPVISKSTASGITILTSPPLSFTIELEKADTLTLAFDNFYHEAKVVDEIGDSVTVMQGIMTITEARV